MPIYRLVIIVEAESPDKVVETVANNDEAIKAVSIEEFDGEAVAYCIRDNQN